MVNSNNVLHNLIMQKNQPSPQSKPMKPSHLTNQKQTKDGIANTMMGTKSSITYSKNFNKNMNNSFLKKAKLQESEIASIILENISGVTYKRNISNPYPGGAKKSAVPHGVLTKIANENAPKVNASKVITAMNNIDKRNHQMNLSAHRVQSDLAKLKNQ